MCTIIILSRPGHEWPMLVGTNRDEIIGRSWDSPAKHWPQTYPAVTAGRDTLSHGSWMGINDNGVVAIITNKLGTLGKVEGKKSRGTFVLEGLKDSKTASEAAGLITSKYKAADYREFFLLFADKSGALLIENDGTKFTTHKIPDGHSIISPLGLNIDSCVRTGHYLPILRSAELPDPAHDEWKGWIEILASENKDRPYDGICIDVPGNATTLSSTLIALGRGRENHMLFASGMPKKAPYEKISLDRKEIWVGKASYDDGKEVGQTPD